MSRYFRLVNEKNKEAALRTSIAFAEYQRFIETADSNLLKALGVAA